MKLKMTLAITAMIALILPAAAAAHVTVSPEEAPADGYAMLEFVVPHGCDAAPTTSISVKMPPQVISATPGEVAGWSIKTKEGKLPQPAEQHGETITEGVREVTWSGGPLPDGHLQQFALSVAFAGAPGEAAPFKVIQECAGGAETAWIQEAAEGAAEPEHPAPTVMLTAAEDEHGTEAEAEPASGSDSDESSNDGIAIAALVVGALGLLFGGAALVRSRR